MNTDIIPRTFLPDSLSLRFGDVGDYVELVQNRLVEQSLLQTEQVTGEYDERTAGAVKHFQGLNGLTDDGVVGPKTARALKLTKDSAEEDEASGDTTAEEAEEEVELAPEDPELTLEELLRQQQEELAAKEAHLQEENLTALKNKEASEAKLEAQAELTKAMADSPANAHLKKETAAELSEKQQNRHEAMEEMLEGQAELRQGADELAANQDIAQGMEQSLAQAHQDMQADAPRMPQEKVDPIILDGQGFEELQARIEARLDQSTLNTVKVTGTTLAAAGVRESAVPPEFDIGKSAAPAIARQEQQQMEIG